MNGFGVKSSAVMVVVLLAATACHGQVATSTPCSLSFYRYLYNLPGEQIRPNVPEGTYVFGKQVGPAVPEGQASDSRPTVVRPPYEAPLYLPPSTAAPTTTTTTTTTTTPRPSTSAPLYIPPVDYPLDGSNAVDSSNSVSVSVPVQKADCKQPGHVHHVVDSELLPPFRVPEFVTPKVDPPKFQFPKFEPPKVEPPKYQFPKFDPPKVEPPKFQFPKFEAPKVEPPKFQFPKFEAPKFQPQVPAFQPPVFRPQVPAFQPQVPAFQPQSTFLVPKFAPIAQKPVVVDDNEIFGQRTRIVQVQQSQPRYPVPTPPPQFGRPYGAPQIVPVASHDHEDCDKPHAIPSPTTTTTTTTTEAAPEPVVETRQNEIYGYPAVEKEEPHQDCDGTEEESRGVPSTDYGVVPSPSAGYSYDRPAAPLEYPTVPAASTGYAYPKGSPSFDYPAPSAFGQAATSLFESSKSSAGEDHGDLVILKV